MRLVRASQMPKIPLLRGCSDDGSIFFLNIEESITSNRKFWGIHFMKDPSFKGRRIFRPQVEDDDHQLSVQHKNLPSKEEVNSAKARMLLRCFLHVVLYKVCGIYLDEHILTFYVPQPMKTSLFVAVLPGYQHLGGCLDWWGVDTSNTSQASRRSHPIALEALRSGCHRGGLVIMLWVWRWYLRDSYTLED